MGSPTAELSPAKIEYEDEEIDTDNMLFMDNKSIKFNNGNITNDSAVYMGPVSHVNRTIIRDIAIIELN